MVDERRRLLLGTLIGASIGLLLVMLIVSNASGPASLVFLVLIPVVGACLWDGAVSSYLGAGPFLVTERTPLAPQEIHRRAIRWYATDGWTFKGSESDTLVFTHGSSITTGDGGCLLLLAGLPDLLYLLLARKRQTTTIITMPAAGGAEMEFILSARGSGGQASAVRFFTSLHDPVAS